jgi:hypothetical protein
MNMMVDPANDDGNCLPSQVIIEKMGTIMMMMMILDRKTAFLPHRP